MTTKKLLRKKVLVCPSCNYIFPFTMKAKKGTEVYCICDNGFWLHKGNNLWTWITKR